MQKRHKDRFRYFQELARTTKEYYIELLRSLDISIGVGTRVLEIGCGEGGNLLPFAQMGCSVTGIDICSSRIEQAAEFFKREKQQGSFLCENFVLLDNSKGEIGTFDIIIVRDVIEHIEPPYKKDFMTHIKDYMTERSVVLVCFPAWQNPFGGHQQISDGFVSKIPFIHLLPNPLYKAILTLSGTKSDTIQELFSIKRSQVTVESFERLIKTIGFTVIIRQLWLINPHYKQKFHLTPRLLAPIFSKIKYLRNFYTTSCTYVLKI